MALLGICMAVRFCQAEHAEGVRLYVHIGMDNFE